MVGSMLLTWAVQLRKIEANVYIMRVILHAWALIQRL